MSALSVAQGIGYLTVREVECIKVVAGFLPFNPLCVNIGSGAGTSVLAVYEARSDAQIVDIDINPENGIPQLLAEGVTNSTRYNRLTADSKSVPPLPFDLLFVDGDHTEEGIRGDLAHWLDHAREGAYVLVHDYWPYPDDHPLAGVDYWPDVRRVCDDVLAGCEVVMDVDRLRVYRV